MGHSLDQVLAPASHELAITAITEELARDGQPGVDPDRAPGPGTGAAPQGRLHRLDRAGGIIFAGHRRQTNVHSHGGTGHHGT